MLFGIVLFISAIVGAIVVSNVALVTLIAGLIGFIFTFPYAVIVAPILAVFWVLTGHRGKGESLLREANKLAWRPWTWAGHLIAFMWARLGNYLSEGQSAETRQDTIITRSGQPHSLPRPPPQRGQGVVYSNVVQERQAALPATGNESQRDREDANVMLVVTAIFDLGIVIALLVIL